MNLLYRVAKHSGIGNIATQSSTGIMTATKASAAQNRSAKQRCPPNRFRVAPFNYDYDTTPSRPPIAKKPRRRHQNYGYDSLPPVRQPPNRYHPKNRLPPVAVWPNRDPLQEDGSLNLYCFCVNSPANQVDFLGQSIIFNPIQLPPHNNPNPSGNGLSQTGNTTATFDNVKWNSTPCSCGGSSFTFSGTLTVKDWWVNGDNKAKAHEEHHVALWKQALDSINTFQTPDTCVPSCYGNIMNAALSAGVAQGNYLNAQFDADQYGNIDPPAVTRSANALAAYNKALNDFLNAYAHCMQK